MTTLDSHLRRTAVQPPLLAGVGIALALVIVFAGNYHVGNGENGGMGPALITGIGCLVLTGILFALILPRHITPRTAVIVGVLAILSIAAFWSGATPVLAAACLAATANQTPGRGVRVVQGLAVLAAAIALIVTLAQSHLF